MSNRRVVLFIVSLCFICGFLLAFVSYLLSEPQRIAKEFDQSKQMLIAAKILNPKGVFQIREGDKLCDALYDPQTKKITLWKGEKKPKPATEDQIKEVAKERIRPLLTDSGGKIYSLEEKKIDLPAYLAENKKTGYANLQYKLVYAILPNEKKEGADDIVKEAESFVIPVSGFGLWAPIYGYIAMSPDGNHVIGTTWYEHGETPGLGANITEPWWQDQFFEKQIFQESAGGQTDFQTTSIGIIVVKGKVQDVYGDSPKSKSAVDGMSGATLTGDGVTIAYRNSLSPYRNFFIALRKQNGT